MLPDYKGNVGTSGEAPTSAEREDWTERFQHFFKCCERRQRPESSSSSGSSSSEEEEVERSGADKRRGKKKLVANAIQARALDHALLTGSGHAFRRYQLPRKIGPLGKQEERFVVDASSVPGFTIDDEDELPEGLRPTRSCILDKSTGKTHLETAGMRDHPVLFSVPDQGPCGWPLCFWLFMHCQLFGWFWGDWHHRIWNDVKLAFRHAGVWLVMLELTIVCNMFSGPFEGHAWWSAISEAAKALTRSCKYTCDMYAYFYEAICRDLNGGTLPDFFGAAQHMREVWKQIHRAAYMCEQA